MRRRRGPDRAWGYGGGEFVRYSGAMCGAPVVLGSRCLKHLVLARERQRQKKGLKRRYWRTLSYRLAGGKGSGEW